MANSWKKYGGIYKSDKYNSIGVGTMVADQVLIRQRVITSSQVAGSLIVGENASIGNDLTVTKDTTVNGELFAKTNAYIGEKLYFNKNTDAITNYVAYISGNSKTGNIGIGTTTPTSFLDINVSNSIINSGIDGSTIGNNITNVLTVRNSNNYIRNIIAQNVHNSGVVVDTSGNIASFGFYNKNINVNTSSPVHSITADVSNSSLKISGADNTINSTNNTYIDSGLNLTITTDNITNINSIVTISKKSGSEQSLNGTITIYDNSATIFLSDYYEEDTVKSGNAVTVVSSDISSNAFINIVTPNKNGFSVGGGAYPGDITRSMGTIGILNTDSSYIPTQVIISNTDPIKYRTSVGFNTYAPESNKYVVDINGPTRIGNGELHVRKHSNFQQNSTHFSKQNPLFGTIVGTPYNLSQAGDQTYYASNILYTNDGGITWTDYTLLDIFVETLTYDVLSGRAVDNNSIFVISNTAKIGYINTDTKQITTVVYNPVTRFNALYVEHNGAYKILIGGEVIVDEIAKPSYFYYKLNEISFTVGLNVPPNILDASCSNITHCDGSNHIVYFIGNGIEKIDFSLDIPISLRYDYPSNTYNNIFAYDENYVVVCGLSNIIYTYDGGETWNNADTQSFNINYNYNGFNSNESYASFTIKSISLYDNIFGIALGTITYTTGEYNLIIYTSDGSKTWNRINPKIFYSSGVGHILEKPTINSIYMLTKEDVVIVDNQINGRETPFIAGTSSMMRGFYPNIFNTFTNQVVEVNGGMNVDGKIWQF